MRILIEQRVNSLLAAVLFLTVSALTAAVVSASPAGKISAPDLISALERGEEVTVIDVRTPEEFEDGHIPGSISVPLDELAEGEDLPSGVVVVYCTTGVRSAKALRVLEEAGKAEVKELEGGIRSWIAAGGNIVAGPYKDTTDYPATYQIPKGVCETKPPVMEIEE